MQMPSFLLRYICLVALMIVWLSGCAPPDPEPTKEVKQTSANPFSIAGYLPNAVKLDSINPRGWGFTFGYDALQRLTSVSIKAANNLGSEGTIKISYLPGSSNPAEIRLTNLPAAIWPPNTDAIFDFEYNLNGRVSKIIRTKSISANLTLVEQVCTYRYQDERFVSSLILSNPDEKDSTVVSSWNAGLAAEMTTYNIITRRPVRIQTINAKHDADSCRTFYEAVLSNAGQVTTISNLSLGAVADKQAIYRYNPLWPLTYLQYLQDLRMPPPKFDARLARLATGAASGGCSNQAVLSFSFSVLPLGLDTTGDNRLLPPSRVAFEFKNFCGGGFVNTTGQIVSYTKAK